MVQVLRQVTELTSVTQTISSYLTNKAFQIKVRYVEKVGMTVSYGRRTPLNRHHNFAYRDTQLAKKCYIVLQYLDFLTML